MLTFTRGSLFTSSSEAFVNTVNCVGVMGKGIALQFVTAFPEILEPYKAACKNGNLRVGKVQVIKLSPSVIEFPKCVINFPTKIHWRDPSQIHWISFGLTSLLAEIKRLKIKSVAMPALGCGNGGLRWSDVRPRIEAAFAGRDYLNVEVFEPEN